MAGTAIRRDLLDSLIQSLNVRAIQPTAGQVNITQGTLTAYVNEERIRKEIKTHSWPAYWKHHKKILTKEKSPALFDAFSSIDTFRSYMSTIKIDTESAYSYSSDYSDGLNIYITAGSYKYYYYGNLENFKQPWHDEPENAPMPGRKYTYLYTRTPIFNYSINKYLLAILPWNFVRISQTRNEDLMENYLVWFIRHQDFPRIRK